MRTRGKLCVFLELSCISQLFVTVTKQPRQAPLIKEGDLFWFMASGVHSPKLVGREVGLESGDGFYWQSPQEHHTTAARPCTRVSLTLSP